MVAAHLRSGARLALYDGSEYSYVVVARLKDGHFMCLKLGMTATGQTHYHGFTVVTIEDWLITELKGITQPGSVDLRFPSVVRLFELEQLATSLLRFRTAWGLMGGHDVATRQAWAVENSETIRQYVRHAVEQAVEAGVLREDADTKQAVLDELPTYMRNSRTEDYLSAPSSALSEWVAHLVFARLLVRLLYGR